MNMGYLLKSLAFVWKKARIWLLVSTLLHGLIGCLPFFQLIILQKLINNITNVVFNKQESYTVILILLLLQFVLTVSSTIMFNVLAVMNTSVEIKIDHLIGKAVNEKASKVPFAYFDIPDFYHHHDRVKGQYGNKLLGPVNSVLELIQAAITLLSYLTFLFLIHWIFIIISLIAAIPLLIVRIKYSNEKFYLVKFQTPSAREAAYTSSLLNNRQAAKEVRLFGLASSLNTRWEKLFLKNSKEYLKIVKREKTSQIGLDALTALFFGASGLTIIYLLRLGKMDVGGFVATTSAIQGAQGAFNNIAVQIANVYEKNLYIEDLFKFLEYENEMLKINTDVKSEENFPSPLKTGISIENISFKYPGTDKNVLHNINLNIKSGEKVAIVGSNGSGKTTLIKCLLGLYIPQKGSIKFDNIDFNRFKQEDVQKNISVIFQDFMRYAYSIKDNITFGNLEEANNSKLLDDTLLKSGLSPLINKLNNGVDTYLGKMLYDGVDLSGGQWQKLAIARAIFSNSPIMILDEPTSALDPKSELEIYRFFNKITQDKTTIFISHRMAAAKMADRIIVMKDGKIIEQGTHNELINNCKTYYEMFHSQARWYAS
ncbi:hypothetical protein AB685_19485 [Bacillus sp. LL01]|nr:hypothetical protein AB685_19485 [Bacillus sp. LL01]